MILLGDCPVKMRDGTVKTLNELGGEVSSLTPNTPVKTSEGEVGLGEYIQNQSILTPETPVIEEDEDPIELVDYIERVAGNVPLTPYTQVDIGSGDPTTLEDYVEGIAVSTNFVDVIDLSYEISIPPGQSATDTKEVTLTENGYKFVAYWIDASGGGNRYCAFADIPGAILTLVKSVLDNPVIPVNTQINLVNTWNSPGFSVTGVSFKKLSSNYGLTFTVTNGDRDDVMNVYFASVKAKD